MNATFAPELELWTIELSNRKPGWYAILGREGHAGNVVADSICEPRYAKFIASAPKLLAACMEILPFVEVDQMENAGDDPYQIAITNLQAAIAKAKGEHQPA